MFFLGAAFMLLETRSLVTFALLFGSTWLVNSLVFFAILCSVMLAVFLSLALPTPAVAAAVRGAPRRAGAGLPDPAGRVPVDRVPAAALRRRQLDRVPPGVHRQPGLRRVVQGHRAERRRGVRVEPDRDHGGRHARIRVAADGVSPPAAAGDRVLRWSRRGCCAVDGSPPWPSPKSSRASRSPSQW